MKRYRISIFCDDKRSDVVMDLRPTEVKVVERVSALLLARLEEVGNDAPWMDVEEVKE